MEKYNYKLSENIYIDRFQELLGNDMPDANLLKEVNYKRWFTDDELKLVNLVETRGVAIFDCKKLIDEIDDFISKGILINSPLKYGKDIFKDKIDHKNVEIIYETKNMVIPTKIIKKYMPNSDLSIQVNIKNYTIDSEDIKKLNIDDITIGTGSYCNTHNFGHLILISLYSINNKIYFDRLNETLVHEFNHYKTEQEIDRSYATNKINTKEIDNLILNQNGIEYYIGFILYRLWNKEERCAGAASVYGYIERINKRENFGNDIRGSKAWMEYKSFNDFIHYIEKFAKDKNYIKIADILNKDLPVDKENNKIVSDSFKKWFINTSYKLNEDYLERIVRCASLKYQELENKL